VPSGAARAKRSAPAIAAAAKRTNSRLGTVANHKRKRPKNARAGCLLCKRWKVNGFAITRIDAEQFANHRRRFFADRYVREARQGVFEE